MGLNFVEALTAAGAAAFVSKGCLSEELYGAVAAPENCARMCGPTEGVKLPRGRAVVERSRTGGRPPHDEPDDRDDEK